MKLLVLAVSCVLVSGVLADRSYGHWDQLEHLNHLLGWWAWPPAPSHATRLYIIPVVAAHPPLATTTTTTTAAAAATDTSATTAAPPTAVMLPQPVQDTPEVRRVKETFLEQYRLAARAAAADPEQPPAELTTPESTSASLQASRSDPKRKRATAAPAGPAGPAAVAAYQQKPHPALPATSWFSYEPLNTVTISHPRRP